VIFETHATSVDQAIGQVLRRTQAGSCSDLRRSYRTAEIAFAGGKTPIHRGARLREIGVEAATLNHIIEPFPGGESYGQACGRLIALLREIAHEHADGTPAALRRPGSSRQCPRPFYSPGV
jgi:broad specificity phosphatase PhoE